MDTVIYDDEGPVLISCYEENNERHEFKYKFKVFLLKKIGKRHMIFYWVECRNDGTLDLNAIDSFKSGLNFMRRFIKQPISRNYNIYSFVKKNFLRMDAKFRDHRFFGMFLAITVC